MSLETVSKIYQNLQKDDLCFIYQGEFTDDMTEKIINLSEYNIEKIEDLKKLKKRISFLMVESFQNIVRHGQKPGLLNRTVNKPVMFLVRNIGSTYYITSANLIENKNIDNLKTKLNRVNELTAEELKTLYREILSTGEVSEKGGAGLGFIEMARKTGKKLEFDFEEVNDKLSFFYLRLTLQGESSSQEEPQQKSMPLNIASNFHATLSADNILMVYKGDFSRSSIMPILHMIEENMEKQLDEFKIKKKIYLILVEILQNISKHSLEREGVREGIFLIGKRDQHYTITAGNLIENNNADLLKKRLNKINQLDKKALNELYKNTLREGITTAKGGSGLGLIDIARDSDSILDYDFIPVENNLLFYALSVQI
ncbi:MAG: hypothetical protein IIA88_04690 [Bacteroidetes bacterium]|nr:hypothetical protein [Bacteroidota bacterium]